MKKEFLEAGKIVNTHGIRGELKLQPWADSAEFLMDFDTLYLDGQARKVLHSFVHKSMLIVALEGVTDVNEAMRLKNRVVCIRRADARLPEGGFFLQDIIGAEVFSEDGTALGRLADVLDLPAGQVYVVQGGREILIPAVPEFVLRVDADAQRLTVRLIEGM